MLCECEISMIHTHTHIIYLKMKAYMDRSMATEIKQWITYHLYINKKKNKYVYIYIKINDYTIYNSEKRKYNDNIPQTYPSHIFSTSSRNQAAKHWLGPRGS